MGLFNKKISKTTANRLETEVGMETISFNERPRICGIDLDKEVIEKLKKSGFNIYSGSLGDKIKVPNTSRQHNYQLIPDYDFPPNLHEYDIVILDLVNFKTIDYKAEDHIRTNHTGKSVWSLLSSYPETIFDPRPLSSANLYKKLNQIGDRKHIVIIFTSSSYSIEYEMWKITGDYVEEQKTEKYNIYDFLGYTPLSEIKFGKEMIVCNIRDDFKKLLEDHLANASYNQTFHHPKKWNNGEDTPDPHYLPLIRNSSNNIVSFCESRENSFIFFFPQIERKEDFLDNFLTKIAPDILPEIFPFSTTFSWKDNEDYWLPNHQRILNEKKAIEEEYEEKIKSKDIELANNSKQYSFLHEIITETGDNLVNAVVEYLKWLGFSKVTKVDDENSNSTVLEEDIQVELNDGLLIIECKGIGGTSTDSDCSQISKIKHRRSRERNRFDVYALYIVNHQRYLPPLSRQNPPFTENQRQDAVNDERGLITTWQLFNLYFEIESDVMDKESARKDLLSFGFVEFRPHNLTLIDEPKELFQNGKICIVNTTDVELSVADEILVEKNGKFAKTTIEGIQIDGRPVTSVENGEIGLQLSTPIKKKSRLWKKVSIPHESGVRSADVPT